MKLLGFNLTRINAEKDEKNKSIKGLKVKNNIDLTNISEVKNNLLKTKEDLVAVYFKYSIIYEPNFAKLNFEGNLLISLESKNAKKLIKDWKENEKKIQEEIKIDIFNFILRKINLKALNLEEELNLPLHVSLPRIDKKAVLEK